VLEGNKENEEKAVEQRFPLPKVDLGVTAAGGCLKKTRRERGGGGGPEEKSSITKDGNKTERLLGQSDKLASIAVSLDVGHQRVRRMSTNGPTTG